MKCGIPIKHCGKFGNMFIKDFWVGKRVLVTGHTGFKGSWLCLLLSYLGAEVTGYALSPPTNPSLFDIANINKLVKSFEGEIRDYDQLLKILSQEKPEIVIHMAAQSLVRKSYRDPLETFQVNIIGTANLLEAIRYVPSVRVLVNVTTDKCYENKEWIWGYREDEPLGGHDPYSSSKACSELVTAAYRRSFFSDSSCEIAIASARAGNVIGGGDWAEDRLVPDFIRAILNGENITIRNPTAIRPWQHVLEPLNGYLTLAQLMYNEGKKYSGSFNFGPDESDARCVEWVIRRLCDTWGSDINFQVYNKNEPHEATYLKLDCSKAKNELGWYPVWTLEVALDSIIEFTKTWINRDDIIDICMKQIKVFESQSLAKSLKKSN